MAEPAVQEEPDSALEDQSASSKALEAVHERALRNFDISVLPQLEQRTLCLAARRFVNIPGAMWEGDFGAAFPDEIKMEIPLVKEGIDKIKRDYNEHRIVPDFRPAAGKGNDDTAENLDGIYRADMNCYKSMAAVDNAVGEAIDGGMGAWRLTNEWADPYDKDSDDQRINPAAIITDADQRVFFGPSERYDKSDAPYAFLITAHARSLFEERYPEGISNWPEPRLDPVYDWFTPDVVKVAEYYELQDVTEKLYILTHVLSKAEERYWDSEIDDEELAQLKKMGWKVKTRELKRKRVHKYLMSGAEVLEDKGLIAGDQIPIVPVYGKRAFVDGVERFEGYTQSRMDIQKLYNMAVSKMAETSAQSPRSMPIFAPEQVVGLEGHWANQVVERHAYALARPLMNDDGSVASMGPIGMLEPAQVDPNGGALIEICRADLTEQQQDGADEVKANTSADALEVAATRVDAKSGIYLDNVRQSVQRGGEIYLSMCADVYYEPGREVETQDDDGNDGTATLVQQYTDQTGKSGYLNDFTRGHYKVVVEVTEATATRRDKTVKSCLNLAEMFVQLDPEMALAAGVTAVANMDGEGMTDLQKFARKKGVMAGLIEPTEEEKAEMQQAAADAQNQSDPNADLIAAQTDEKKASAFEKQAGGVLKIAQAHALGGPEEAPAVPDGLEAAHKAADIDLKTANAEHIRQKTAHLPEELKIEATNARSNKLKAFASLFQKKNNAASGNK